MKKYTEVMEWPSQSPDLNLIAMYPDMYANLVTW